MINNMNREYIMLTEDYLIAKGYVAFMENPDKVSLERQIMIETYMKSKYNRIKYLIDAEKNTSEESEE